MKFLVASILVSVVTFLLEIRMTFSCGRYCTYTDIHLGMMKRNDILDNCDHFPGHEDYCKCFGCNFGEGPCLTHDDCRYGMHCGARNCLGNFKTITYS